MESDNDEQSKQDIDAGVQAGGRAPVRHGQRMNENRMKTSVNTGEVSLPPAQAVGWGRKIRAEPGACTAKQISSTENWLATPSDGRIIAKMTGETNLQHEHQGKWEIPV